MAVTCGQCAGDAPSGARFCPSCGSALGPRTCRSCGAAAETGRFCAHCGTVLEDPAGRTDRMPAARGSALGVGTPVAERRITSVVFGDLVGFTALSEGRDAEEVRDLLSRYFAAARLVIERYGGTVEKFIGDAVMAVWGVPVAHEDDAERAVRAGMELVEAVRVLGGEVGVVGLDMRVGVVTGEVAVTIGASGQGMVAGDAVNTASRVQSVAPAGRVWVDERTRNLTASSVSYRAMGAHTLKGKSESLPLFEAGSVVASLGGADRIDGLDSVMIGRDRELRLLKELFHGTEDAARPTVLVLEGEAGVGKSRLAWEFEKYIDGLSATIRWHRGRCLSYGEGVAFWALSEAVRVRLGMVEAEMAPVTAEELDAALEPWVPDESERAWLRPRLAVLLGTEEAEPTTREELFSAWVTFFERVGGGDNAVVLVVDDAQYADEALLDFLENLLAVSRSAIFVLLLARTGLVERRPSLATRRRATVLHLEPLADSETGVLLDGLVDGLPESVRDRLVERAEGVPLFAVETVRALIDRDLVVPSEGRYVLADPSAAGLTELAAPASLQALVAARLDALTSDERRVVGDASVLGLSFTRDGIEALSGAQINCDQVLGSLVAKQILSVQSDRFSAEYGQYRFVQTVVRQVAYEMLARRDRKARHLAVVAHFEASVESSDDVLGVLAQHYLDAVDASLGDEDDVPQLVARATELLERAASRARVLGAHAEAERYLRRAMSRTDDDVGLARMSELLAESMIDGGRVADGLQASIEAAAVFERLDDAAGVLRARVVQGRALVELGLNADALRLLEPLWAQMPERPEAVRTYLAMARVVVAARLGLGDQESTVTVLDRRLLMAEALGDTAELAETLAGMGVAYWARGAPFAGRQLLQASAALGRKHGVPLVQARALSNLAAEALSWDLDAAIEYGTEAVVAARKSGVTSVAGFSACNLALSLWTAGRWSELQSVLDQAPDDDGVMFAGVFAGVERWYTDATGAAPPAYVVGIETDDHSILAWLANVALHVQREAGDLAAAARAGAESLDHAVAASGIGDDFMHFWPQAVLTALDAGDLALAARLIAIVTDSPEGLVSPVLRAQQHRLVALLGAARHEPEQQVEAGLRRAIEALDAYGARPDRARTQEELGVFLASLGRSADATALLSAARATYDELGATGWLDRLHGVRSTAG